MSRPWFDPETGMLLFDEYVHEMPSFRKVMEDGVVSVEEFTGQAQKVAGILQQLEEMLSTEQKLVATAALCELAVLHALGQKMAFASPASSHQTETAGRSQS